MGWEAEIVTDPMRDHQLHVELEENGDFRGRIYKDESGTLQLWIYDGPGSIIPLEWLLGIAQRFARDTEGKRSEGAVRGEALEKHC